ncbi:hypothetical protein [Spirosoma linguale]|uniref:Uncharacterized protein n=1 Tax=Spirosoma linguale (strain ATCC 33905 / DSM 74 / LMG 10896 / Claus 1) TaxID=504472 RepID=D2QUD6_SPILD|nr:hypothetical protein Slin_6461 [Spirosoma linguale DSM 74]
MGRRLNTVRTSVLANRLRTNPRQERPRQTFQTLFANLTGTNITLQPYIAAGPATLKLN